MKHVPFVDGSGFIQLINFLEKRKNSGSKVLFAEFWPKVKEELIKNKEFTNLVKKEEIFKDVKDALKYIKENKNKEF